MPSRAPKTKPGPDEPDTGVVRVISKGAFQYLSGFFLALNRLGEETMSPFDGDRTKGLSMCGCFDLKRLSLPPVKTMPLKTVKEIVGRS